MKSVFLALCLFLLPAAVFSAEQTPDQDVKALVAGNTGFAAALYAQLGAEKGNVFFSPFSISTVLAMTYAGAKGETATEMAKALHFTLDQGRLHPAMAKLVKSFSKESVNSEFQLSNANALWVKQNYKIEDSFNSLLSNNYGAEATPLDFSNEEAARKTINDWVAGKTNNKITDLIAPRVLNDNTRLVLTNAVYFKDTWSTPFEKEQTALEDFTTGEGQKIRSQLMHVTGTYYSAKIDGARLISLPYMGGNEAMIIVLPDAVNGLPALEKSLSAEKLAEWFGKLDGSVRFKLTLPKFKITQQALLQEKLLAMGMKQAFLSDIADFSGITGTKELFISAVVHKAYIDVNEDGTEAAAATAVMALGGSAPVDGEPEEFRADHPFLFVIRDNKSGSVLFMGRVNDPTR